MVPSALFPRLSTVSGNDGSSHPSRPTSNEKLVRRYPGGAFGERGGLAHSASLVSSSLWKVWPASSSLLRRPHGSVQTHLTCGKSGSRPRVLRAPVSTRVHETEPVDTANELSSSCATTSPNRTRLTVPPDVAVCVVGLPLDQVASQPDPFVIRSIPKRFFKRMTL